METILVWLGSGFAFAVGIGVGAWLVRTMKVPDKWADRSADLLEARNAIGLREAEALEKIAAWAARN